MDNKKNKNLSNRELELYHEFFADSIIDPNFYNHKAHQLDQADAETSSATIRKEETKFIQSLKNRGNIPTEVWMG
jgi:hypothetical protein